ncbi:MAG: HlyC/CorC family transporter [Oceanicoccus sp.]|uniref:CNNM domain-containing protein n=1 Tax=Oceanicoccus sp. TaxID=2691044 RepID=UPI00262799B9|nr:hemolysin family protein [Oceanicoccus sp.]MCP3907004.1 HlyC/CorC family transporter [Oceanicoccus sp.]MDG1773160.1 hemolysin family protein [Oceanicoccus sp.]
MWLLISYVFIALGFSFLCSIAEAVLLSVSNAHIALMEQQQKKAGELLRKMKEDVNKPLAAILTLNTIAHTIGAAGAGAQAAVVFGSAYVGVASAVLTLLILVFSEIIPKTLGAHYWRQLAPVTAYMLKYLVIVLYPFVKLSESLMGGLTHGPTLAGFSRQEFAAMADLSSQEGQIAEQESRILKNIFLLRATAVTAAMTPRTVVFSLSDAVTVEEFFHKYDHIPFSRIPVYQGEQENITGFVFRSDLLLAKARGNDSKPLSKYRRELTAIPETTTLSTAFNNFLELRMHMLLVVDEYGGIEGIVTLEDILETLLGLEIVDEKDDAVDMQEEARKLWKQRAQRMGIDS